MDMLVTTQWLADTMGASDLRIVDATYFLAEMDRDAPAEYEAQHIPGAVFLNLAELSDSKDPRPSMAPPPEKFASRMASLGLGDGSRIVLYDNSPLRTSARAWWLFQLFGAPKVAILDGGLGKWLAEKRPVESGKVQLRHRHFTVWRDDRGVVDKQHVLGNIASKRAQLVDARSMSRSLPKNRNSAPAWPRVIFPARSACPIRACSTPTAPGSAAMSCGACSMRRG